MAFKTAAGYGNLPNGNFSPVIYSKQVQLAFRKNSVVENITNSDYFGEISNMGDSVKIIKEPEITVKEYARGANVQPQDLDDEDFTLTIDKANYFAFKIDDIEEAHSHVNFSQLASDRAGYRLKDNYDQDVLGYLSGFAQASNNAVASSANSTVNGTKAVSTAGSDELLTSMKLKKGDFGESGGLRAGLQVGRIHGFDVYMSNNLPAVGTGPGTTGSANQNSNFGVIVAGHSSAVATAEQINKTETYRDPDSFADIVRGMHLYGRKILRPEAIVTAKYNVA